MLKVTIHHSRAFIYYSSMKQKTSHRIVSSLIRLTYRSEKLHQKLYR